MLHGKRRERSFLSSENALDPLSAYLLQIVYIKKVSPSCAKYLLLKCEGRLAQRHVLKINGMQIFDP
jgi:hypothetical protein